MVSDTAHNEHTNRYNGIEEPSITIANESEIKKTK